MPTLWAPMRFFFTAPLFGVLGALILLFADVEVWQNRWSPAALGATHAFTLGFLTMIMTGALFQVLPVIIGIVLPMQRGLAILVHVLLTGGTLLLVVGLLKTNPALIGIGLLLLSAAFVSFLGSYFSCLSSSTGTATGSTIALAATSLAITVLLGLGLAALRAWPQYGAPFAGTTDIHLSWGFGGWLMLLIMGVSFQVIPMFHVTPKYPRWITHWIPATLFFALLCGAGAALAGHWSAAISHAIALLALAAYAVTTLWLLRQRKRKSRDATMRFWQLGLSTLLIVLLLFVVRHMAPTTWLGSLNMAIGVLAIGGVAMTIVIGMLQRIVPFLIWLNLLNASMRSGERMPLSNMHQLIPVKRAMMLFYLHALFLFSLLLTLLIPSTGRLAALLLLAEMIFLSTIIGRAVGQYAKFNRQLTAE